LCGSDMWPPYLKLKVNGRRSRRLCMCGSAFISPAATDQRGIGHASGPRAHVLRSDRKSAAQRLKAMRWVRCCGRAAGYVGGAVKSSRTLSSKLPTARGLGPERAFPIFVGTTVLSLGGSLPGLLGLSALRSRRSRRRKLPPCCSPRMTYC